MTTVVSSGDWVIDHPTPLRHLCYEVRSVEGEYVRLRSLHVVTKQRFDCSSWMRDLALIRTKDGHKFNPAVPLGGKDK
jgi:hypothetical protein